MQSEQQDEPGSERRLDAPAAGDLPAGLLEAIIAIGSELELAAVLRRIVQAAADLVDARYGALGVLEGPGSDRLAQFITVGIDQAEIDKIGSLPSGDGVLGLVIREPHPLRLADLSDSASSIGVPAHHPPMHSFLGVPIRVRELAFGNLYLTEKRGGAFDADDERVLVALATAAGMAIQNARLHDEGKRRERWLAASTDVTTTLLSAASSVQALDVVAAHALDIAGGRTSFIALVAGEGRMHLEVAHGEDAGSLVGLDLPDQDDQLVWGVLAATDNLGATAITVPLGRTGTAAGVLGVVLRPEAVQFGAQTTLMLESFAAQAAVAIQIADARRMAERVALSEDRDRIARDLHDLVIQRLFASGMALESSLRLIQDEVAAERVHRVVDDLDTTIREIRSAIYALQNSGRQSDTSLRSRVLATAEAAADGLGFAPSVRLDGPVDTVVPDSVAAQVLAVLVEALSNTARHAKAQHVAVQVSANPGELLVEVRDDGVGLPGAGRRSGLANLAERAASLGGTMQATSAEGGGTRLVWRVPLPA